MPLSNLNQEQLSAATCGAGYNLIIASAGTGKTSTIVGRIATLINSGVKPNEILLLTFTNKAAAEMVARVAKFFGKDIAKQIMAGTFHSVSYKLLKELNVNIPFINKSIDLSKYSLPVVSFILGSIDGVNPCAMWVLVLFLTALVAVGNRTKMIQVAGLFLLAEAIMYYMILNVWLYTWDFVGLDKIITPTVGIVGIIGGIFFIRSFVVNGDELACEVTDFEKKAKISTRIQDIAKKPFNIITALAIIGLALSVNVIEFACSIGIPQTFTKILQMNDVNFITRQFYNFLYIIGYMLDDMLVFGLALFSVNKLHLTSRYAKWANLFGGILMVLLGLMLIFKPTWLIF